SRLAAICELWEREGGMGVEAGRGRAPSPSLPEPLGLLWRAAGLSLEPGGLTVFLLPVVAMRDSKWREGRIWKETHGRSIEQRWTNCAPTSDPLAEAGSSGEHERKAHAERLASQDEESRTCKKAESFRVLE
ncbi:hypothetical protein B0H14DRAFT_2658626, partial [Mycena olivaceomarginata]